MNIFVIVAFAKVNDYVNQAWPLAGLYAFILLLEKLIPSLEPPNYPVILLDVLLSFGIAGGLFTLLNRFQDSIVAWLFILVVGVGILTYLSP